MNDNGYDPKAVDDQLFAEVRRLDAADNNASLRITDVLGHMASVDGSLWSMGRHINDMVQEMKLQRKYLEALCAKAGVVVP